MKIKEEKDDLRPMLLEELPVGSVFTFETSNRYFLKTRGIGKSSWTDLCVEMEAGTVHNYHKKKMVLVPYDVYLVVKLSPSD